ncbi:Poly(glycerophosphate) glycerophosphotransferase family protein [Streptococcus pneumoniae 2070335]|nr:Poly(glycerophosphate) glycerophosphotransferase family protein [Streptococcus pneumoniae 2070335]
MNAYNLDYSKLIHVFQNKFRKNVKILVRFHPNVDSSFINLQDTDCINVSTYSNPQDLMMSADVMITDYSSASIDFMLLNRPVFLYLPDYQSYVNDRPLDDNFDKLPFPRAYHNNELTEIIRDFERSKYDEKVRLYELEDVRFDRGKASVQCANWIEEK